MCIFISYSSVDEKLALEIREKLDERSISSFLAPKDLKSGDLFEDKIRDSLLTCTEVFLLVTPNSLKSEWVISEYGAAWVLKKTIVPILFRCNPEDLPSKLANRQAKDFHEIDTIINEFEGRHKNRKEKEQKIQTLESDKENKDQLNRTENYKKLLGITRYYRKLISNDEIEILKFLAKNYSWYSVDLLVTNLHMPFPKVEYYIENLTDQEYLDGHFEIEKPSSYRLGKRGKAYLVENNII